MEKILDQLKQAGAKIKELWAGSSLNRKLIYAGAIIFIVIAASVLFVGNKQAPYEVLYTELGEKDASAIVAKLDEYKTPYKLDNDGTTILVPPADKYTTRLKLAGANLPMGVAGLELFQTNNFGETQTDKKVKYQMAMQGELARTIQSLEKVKAARVHLVIPEKTLFSDKEELPSASVAITTKDETKLTPQEVQGIINLIANSVEGLDPKKVVIVDHNGNLISEDLPQKGTTTEMLASQMAMKKQIETEKQLAIQSMLDSALGKNNSVVRVSAELNFDDKEQKSETYDHDPDGSFTRSEHIIKEAGTGTTQSTAAVPGTDTNIQQYTQVNPTGGTSTTDKSDITRNYEINKTESVIKYSTGETKYDYLTVAILVNNAATAQSNLGDTEAAKITKIRNIAATACGLKENRPNETVSLVDNISVAFIDFYSEPVPEPPPASAVQKILSSPLTPFAFALAAVLIVVLVWLLIRRRKQQEIEEEQEREAELSFETVADEEISIGDLLEKNLSPEEKERQKIRQEIEKLIDESPESAAQVLKTWLLEEQR
ncbi:MAG: flagellar basal-body MS-ring/collar protein FliF [Syntrophomonadaceae bacterium]|nr:flagellar basal-body MS-ring/collar protein FliF [Syntrophomonadaceae bacterium]